MAFESTFRQCSCQGQDPARATDLSVLNREVDGTSWEHSSLVVQLSEQARDISAVVNVDVQRRGMLGKSRHCHNLTGVNHHIAGARRDTCRCDSNVKPTRSSW